MPIPLEKIQVVEDEIERFNNEDDDDKNHHTTMRAPKQDFSYLNKPTNAKRSVHYDIETINNHEHELFRPLSKTEQPPSIDNVLRRRYIAHWGLPGKQRTIHLIDDFHLPNFFSFF
jgi:hypothetical protein